MYGEEKSDSLIVAAKLANNPLGSEPRETRNSHTCAGRRARKVCHRDCHACEKLRKKERFTASFHFLIAEALAPFPVKTQQNGGGLCHQ
ncbi:hypothetical protein BBW68_13940 [Candidatus Erwinia dacicola]|uniref:Uncharacterized protein n=1 Tax=Candidatus Erwinia dacicola TaxID=252393 RepID=A0A1E7YWM2_9GAMM|nr:hypothetical protein BBW68_13940 [Candidatus Erwinia dacicola]